MFKNKLHLKVNLKFQNMKKLYSLLTVLFTVTFISAQLVVTNVSAGVIKLTYGQSNDYSLYGPGVGTTSFWVHTWIPSTAHNDAWTNSNVEMIWNAGISAYEATIDLNTKVFTNSNTTVPANTTVDEMGMVFKNQQNGATSQSSDIIIGGSTDAYGFTGTTTQGSLGISEFSNLKNKTLVSKGMLYTTKEGTLDITVFDFNGRMIKNMKVNASSNLIDLGVEKEGAYIVRVSNNEGTEAIKFLK